MTEWEKKHQNTVESDRKREIDAELRALEVREIEMRLEDATEKYEAFEAQFSADRDRWLTELEHAPMTAFGRKKELKQRLAELDERLADYRAELALDELTEQYRRMTQSKGS